MGQRGIIFPSEWVRGYAECDGKQDPAFLELCLYSFKEGNFQCKVCVGLNEMGYVFIYFDFGGSAGLDLIIGPLGVTGVSDLMLKQIPGSNIT